jgi:hypothetical protein
MKPNRHSQRRLFLAGGLSMVVVAGLTVFGLPSPVRGGWACFRAKKAESIVCPGPIDEGGNWYWLQSPEQERRVVISLYNRYCVRCHGIDGRGVWDMPCVPDFTNARWQSSRSDHQIACITLEGRGAVMPPFRGTLTLEEAWAMARYLRTFGEMPAASEIAPSPKAGNDLPPSKGDSK